MKVYNFTQRSPEWTIARLGLPTASNFDKIITPKTGKLSASSERYIHTLLAEWIYGAPLDDARSTYQSQAMQFGQDAEPQARTEYELIKNVSVDVVGFVTNDAGTVGCSPDGLIGADGGLELKGHTALPEHVRAMLKRAIDDEHKPQVQGCLWLCEREWWDVVSYFPAVPTVIVRATRDEEYISKLSDALAAFTDTLEAAKHALDREYGITALKAAQGKVQSSEFDVTDADLEAILAAQRMESR